MEKNEHYFTKYELQMVLDGTERQAKKTKCKEGWDTMDNVYILHHEMPL